MAVSSTSWRPGQSGNPNGRPSKTVTAAGVWREYLEADDGDKTRLLQLAEKLYALAMNEGSIPAARLLLDRSYGLLKEQEPTGDEPREETQLYEFLQQHPRLRRDYASWLMSQSA